MYSTSAHILNCSLKLALFPAAVRWLSLAGGAVHEALSRRRGGEVRLEVRAAKGACFPGEEVQLLEQQRSPSCCLGAWGKGVSDHPGDYGAGGESVGGPPA